MELTNIQENFPFLSCVRCQGTEYIGIIQNHDDKIMSFYDFDSSRTSNEKQLCFTDGDVWWHESNRLLPISIFLTGRMTQYRYCLKTVNMKDVTVEFGPITSLNNLIKKRIKKRQIQLIKKT